MRRSARLGIAALVVLAGCLGFSGSPSLPETAPASSDRSPEVTLEELDGAWFWIDGTVEHIDGDTLYVDDQPYTDVVVPVVISRSPLFYCRPSADSDIECEPGSPERVAPGEDVCALVRIQERTLQGGKVFFNASCGGPLPPSRN